uniref:Tubulin polymerization-promoting protein family member 3 n=1 Tax=Neogobius melanostomus TaxID=47308 RepID=A0A8C6WP29_9GOBI
MAQTSDVDELLAAFKKFSVHGDHKAAATEMPGQKWAKLCKDCKIIDGKHVTSTDIDIIFSKLVPKTSRGMPYTDFKKALEMLAQKRFPDQSKEDALEATHKLIEGKEPANAGVTKVDKTGAVDRLTDTSRYTGSHKERFDGSGRGRGRHGREYLVENTGYVSSYRHAGTYDSKVKGPPGKPAPGPPGSKIK